LAAIDLTTLKEDQPGTSAPGIDGRKEQSFFDAAEGNHKQKMLETELGRVGRFLGGEKNAPTSVALIFGLLIATFCIGCLALAAYSGNQWWGQMFDRGLAGIATIVAYVFGRGSRS
jgi:hypothetical protein